MAKAYVPVDKDAIHACHAAGILYAEGGTGSMVQVPPGQGTMWLNDAIWPGRKLFVLVDDDDT